MKLFKCSTILKALTAMVLALLMVFGTVSTSIAAVVEGSGASAAAAEEKEVKYSSFFILGDEMGNTYKTPENKMILSDAGYYYKEIKGDGKEKAFSILPDDKKASKPVALDYITEKDAFYSLNDVGSEEKAELRVWLSDDEEAKLCYKAEKDKSMFLLYFPEKSGLNTGEKPVICAASALPTKDQLEGIDPTEVKSDEAEEAAPKLTREDSDLADSGADMDLAESGWGTGDTWTVPNNVTDDWSTGSSCMSDGNDRYFIYYVKYADSTLDDHQVRFRFKAGSQYIGPGGDWWTQNALTNDNNHAGTTPPNNDGNAYFYAPLNNNSKWQRILVGANAAGNYFWASKSDLNDLTATVKVDGGTSAKTINKGDSVTLTGSCSGDFSSYYKDNGDGGKKAEYTYQYKKGSTGTWTDVGKVDIDGSGVGTDSTGKTFTPSSAGTYYVRVIVNDTNVIKNTNAPNDRYTTSSEITVTVKETYNVTYDGNGKTGGTVPSAQTKVEGTALTLATNNLTKTGYTANGWNTKSDGSGTHYNSGASYTTNAALSLYAQWTANTYTVTLDDNSGTGGSGTVTATYGSNLPSVTVPTRTGYTFGGYYSGSTQYINSSGTGVKAWDKANNTTTLTASWTEVKAGATVYAYTDGTASGTGGKVKNGTSGSEVASFTLSSAFGISTKATVLAATPAAGYTFEGWETGGTQGSHIKIYKNSDCTTLYNKATDGGTVTTVYVKSDGASGLNTTNAEVHALFEAAKYTITNNGAYYKNSAAAYASGTTGGTFTVSSTGSLSYNTNLTLTATAASGYAVEGVYWSNNGGSTWTRVTTTNTTSNGYVTAATNNSFKVTDNFTLKAQFVQLKKLSAFDSYEMKNSQVIFVTAPPKSITVKHTDAAGTATTYTYTYDGTKAKGNPNTPEVPNASGTLAIGTGTYGQGNYIQFFAGDEITLTYSAMASSELLKGVFYNNDTEFYVTKPTTAQFVAHTYDNTHALYMNSAYYASVPSGLPTTTVDQDAHSIKFTGTQDYKNIDVEIATKRKVYFSDYTNAVIHSKNMDDYYYDNEALSVTGDQLTVKAAGSATQTNTINKNNVKFYMADANGQPTGSALSGYTVEYNSGTGTISNSGTTDSTRYIIISGNMPAYDLYVDLGISSSYTLKAGSKIMSDPDSSVLYLKQKASTITVGSLSAPSNAYVSSSTTSVTVGNTVTLTVSGLTSGYMFVGWYWGNSDDSAPDYAKGFISDKATFSYKPKKGGTIWAVGTKELFINGSKYITGKSSNWYSENGTWKNQKMSFDPSRGTKGSYYWEITDTMFASAGSNFKTWKTNWDNWDEKTTDYGIYKLSEGNYYWTDNNDSYHGKSYFQFLDTATGNDSKSVWSQIYSFEESQEGATYGKAYMRDEPNDESKRWNGQGFINFNETDYSGYSSPIRIYLDADTKDLDVRPTPIYCDIYVSNGYDVGSTVKTDAVTVQPVVDGVVKTSGQTGYFDVNAGTVYTPDAEGNVTKYSPKKKGATVRITKQAGGSDKIAAFLIYDLDTKTVRAEKNITKGTASGGKTPYYIDLTLSTEKQRLYICPIIEESGAKVTITFDATQLNRAQWGDIVTAYAWYKTTNGPALGAYPGQPMIPSDDMSTWTTSFNPVKNGNEVAGITFSNYVDGKHSWLGCTTDNGGVPSGGTNVMGTVSYGGSGTSASPTTVSIADDGLIKQYNYIESGTNKEYSRANYKAQTYDYHEPVALYDRYKNEESIDITFQMKDGNSSLISWRHSNLILENEIPDGKNILNLPDGWTPLRWEYLTNAKGDKYVDMNGREVDTKPTASFYVASKGLVVYQGSKMNYVFHGGHDYEMKGYSGTYSNGSYSRSALSYWSSDITYGGTANLDMKYAVQWYVYDAQGNYVTTVLSAGIADLASGTTDTYIAKQLEDMGYAVDGKSVAICYDKPRYMYGDWTVTNSANNINSGTDFDAYRFEGQWIANASTAMTRVNVEVAMMTDSGEVLAGSNVSGYGSATANWASGVTFTKTHTLAGDNSWAETATSEAKLNGIELTATSQNFIGWYYYDANTNEFTKATYKEATGFRPNYSTKDITFYAVYRASAIYEFVYTGREGERTYSVAGNDLTAAEMEAGENQNKVQYANHSADILSKIPVGIGIFKKDIVFSSTSVENSTKDNSDEYILRMSGFTPTLPTYTLSVYYKDESGALKQIDTSAVYNGSAIDLTAGSFDIVGGGTKPAGTAVTTYYSTDEHRFIGWYEYDGTTIGELLSTQHNFGMRLTKNQKIIAVYANDGKTLPTDGWKVFIDENQVNKELTSPSTGFFYNDTIVRVRNSSDVTATLPSGAKIGVLVITKPTGVTKEPNSYTTDQLISLVGSVSSGQTKTAGSGLRITNMQATTQTIFNRTDIAVRADYAKTNGAQYCAYAYFYDGSSYHFSDASAVKTYE